MSSNKTDFTIALMNELTSSMTNCYGSDNWDAERFGPYKSTLKSSLISKLNGLLAGSLAIVPLANAPNLDREKLDRSVEGWSDLYELLEDEHSKSTLVQLITYRLLGPRKVKLSLNNASYWSQRQQVRRLVKSREGIQVSTPKAVLSHLTLLEIGYPIELYYTMGGVVSTFMLKQYEYGKAIPPIKVEDSDYVIDAGGGWGDTALYFAHAAGAHGRVFTFEFTPENLEIFARNVNLNPELAPRIELDQRALWNVSGEVFEYVSHGPGTSLDSTRHQNNGGKSLQVTTVSIDDLVREKKLAKVDFIKMDVEGAELNALKGAEQTIRTFKPRLAISVYHKENDLTEIPEYLDGLGLGYKFFLDHFTIHTEETVLFARAST